MVATLTLRMPKDCGKFGSLLDGDLDTLAACAKASRVKHAGAKKLLRARVPRTLIHDMSFETLRPEGMAVY